MSQPRHDAMDIREKIRKAVHHFDHILPAQAPLKDFVHHNTLHGYEHLPFSTALEVSQRHSGIYGYLSEDRFRSLYHQGRITSQNLLEVLDHDPDLRANEILLSLEGRTIRKREVSLCGLVYPFSVLTGPQLRWHIEENKVLQHLQEDLPGPVRQTLLASGESEAVIAANLWRACLKTLGLEHFILHPEELMDLSADLAETCLKASSEEELTNPDLGFQVRHHMERTAMVLLDELLHQLGKKITLRGLLLAITGEDLMEEIRPLLIRQLGNHMDLGLARWHSPDRGEGFYASWRRTAQYDLAGHLTGIPDFVETITQLPQDAMETILLELSLRGIPEIHWVDYLLWLALEVPGWSGMVLQRQNRPGYKGLACDCNMVDYLAVRLVLERLFARRLSLRLWNITPDSFFLRHYFRDNKAEFMVRYAMFNLRLPEYAMHRAHRLVNIAMGHAPDQNEWDFVAQLIWTWRYSPNAEKPGKHSAYHDGWRLFRLVQHLGLTLQQVEPISTDQVGGLLSTLEHLTPSKAGFIWLQAYENHYRDQLFNAIKQNHDRGRWFIRHTRPQAQVIFCMDDREEGIRRHLEEHNPAIETLGAAGFFGVAIHWLGMDDTHPTALCPIVVTPSHEIREVPEDASDPLVIRHQRGRAWHGILERLLFSDTRHHPLLGLATTLVAAPVALMGLTWKILAPVAYKRHKEAWLKKSSPPAPTRLNLTAPEDGQEATPTHNRKGFTDAEQADRVERFLRSMGLIQHFSPMVVMMGHGSSSENNPHLAAYDCGACSGRHGGPNARVFATMANRPEVRTLLRAKGISIPEDTWFIGAFHNTCNEDIQWSDLHLLPPGLSQAFASLKADMTIAAQGSAHERCRKLDSSPDDPTPPWAWKNIQRHGSDISQVRPEYGHSTNAIAFVGRRALSQGIFLDRRAFLISYDPTTDPEGSLIENILLTLGPVGVGINLEYYFSTVNNDQFGCGSKITHNVVGSFGIMDGTESDLRTGLTLQMIEIHEPMRLQLMVEAKIEILTRIYQRQPALQALIGHGWLLLSAKDPHSQEIHIFKPATGWVPWQGTASAMPMVESSLAWYRGKRNHLPPVFIRQPGERCHV